MKTVTKCVVALILSGSVATPVLAATSTTTNSQTAAPMNEDQNSAKMTNMRQQLTNDLTKAGFTDIKVMPESFAVHAKDSKGNPVFMVINPDSFTEVTEMSTQKAKSADNSATTSSQTTMSGPKSTSDTAAPAKP